MMSRSVWLAMSILVVAMLGVNRPVAANGLDATTLVRDGVVVFGITAALYPNHPDLSRRLFFTLLDTGVVTVGLKLIAGAPRPWEDDDPTWRPLSGQDSWPSGHTAIAFAMVETLAEEYSRYRVWLYGAATAVGASRVKSGMHHWEDVVAGAALGYAVARYGPVFTWKF